MARNSCAFVSVINMVALGKWKQERVVKADLGGQHLIAAIRAVGATESNYA